MTILEEIIGSLGRKINLSGGNMDENINDMIDNYMKERDFFGSTTEDQISGAEKFLGFRFPDEYREYISKYGSGGICGVEIVGVEGGLGASVIKATERWRKLGLNKSFVVIRDSGEFIMCMEAVENDPCVYSWDRSDPTYKREYDDFTAFLIDAFREAIDNY